MCTCACVRELTYEYVRRLYTYIYYIYRGRARTVLTRKGLANARPNYASVGMRTAAYGSLFVSRMCVCVYYRSNCSTVKIRVDVRVSTDF